MCRKLFFILVSCLALMSCGISDKEEQVQALLQKSWKEYNAGDYLLAQKYITDCAATAQSGHVDGKYWEIPFIQGCVIQKTSSNITDSWMKSILYFKTAYERNPKKEDGVTITYEELLSKYAYGLAQHYGDAGAFMNIISELVDLNRFNAYYYSSIYYSLEDNYSLALQYAQQALKISPKNKDAYIAFSRAYRCAGKLTEARDACQKAITLSPSSAYLYRLMGLCYQEKSEEWLSYMRKAANLNDVEAQSMLTERKIAW